MHLKIERIDFIDIGRDVAHHLHVDRRRSFGFSEFPAQIFSRYVPKRGEVVVKAGVLQ